MKKTIPYIMLVALLCTASPVEAGFFSTMAEMVGLKAKPTFQNITGKHIGWFRGTVKSIVDLEKDLLKAQAQSILSDGKTKVPFRAFKDGVFVLIWNKAKEPRKGRQQMTLDTRVGKNGKAKRYELPAEAVVKYGFKVFYGTPDDPYMKKFLKNEK
jgi:hypothetical protein